MKKILIILFLILILVSLSGCLEWFESSGVKVELKQTFHLSPTTTIEATVPLNLSQLDTGKKTNEIPEKGKFKIEVEIENKNLEDYPNVKVYFTKTSDTIEYAYLYSPSGEHFQTIGENLYDFGTTLISKQTNKMLLVGKVGAISDDVVETHFTLGLYDGNDQPLSVKEYTMRVCKEGYCS